ncbi:PilT protein domain protein [Halothece sp. PCC 7418]|uniref:type II toxin-antitoxin system VapC family toxin n=1 Tax=Halothece sp. (strain PCC 7418) TaxID=65093 RepID=UPI0002A06D2C|nr:type II toxin-antitoxin system VapC family toxin [Halothece sp. PCC 7418]AFZ42352.1 PilT protein domain protein [Halothece sp. PCC 7418]
MGLVLPNSSLIYLDTSVVIYSVEQVPDYYQILEPLWEKVEGGEVRVCSSELIVLETLVLPLRTGNQNLLQAYDQLLLSSSLQLIPIHQEILRNAAQLRGDYNLKTPDAIHLATALRENCNLLLTNDVQFRRVTGLSITILQDALSD